MSVLQHYQSTIPYCQKLRYGASVTLLQWLRNISAVFAAERLSDFIYAVLRRGQLTLQSNLHVHTDAAPDLQAIAKHLLERTTALASFAHIT